MDFTGLAGSGKSYILNKLHKRLDSLGYEVTSINKTHISIVDYLTSIPLLVRSILFVLKTKPSSCSCMISCVFAWFKVQMKLRKSRNFPGIILVDEGYLHKFRKIRRCSNKNIMLESVYNPNFFIPDVTLIIQADAEVVASRLSQRDKSNIDYRILKSEVKVSPTYYDAVFLSINNNRYEFVKFINNKNESIEDIVRKITQKKD